MNRFAGLWDQLTLTATPADRHLLIRRYLSHLATAERGLALVLLTGGRLPGQGRFGKPAIKAMIDARVDATLFQLSADHVGDFTETAALLWPAEPDATNGPPLSAVAEALTVDKSEVAKAVAGLLDRLMPAGRHLLLRIAGGRLRGVVDGPTVIAVLAELGQQPMDTVAEAWHAAEPPYSALLGWLVDGAARPSGAARLGFRPLLPWAVFDDAEVAAWRPGEYLVAPAWDGVRVVLATDGRRVRIFDETGTDISARCPGLAAMRGVDGVFDAVLLADHGANALAYPVVSKKRSETNYTLITIIYDALCLEYEDLRDCPFGVRLAQLEELFARGVSDNFRLAPGLAFDDWAMLDVLRRSNEAGRDGILIRSRNGIYRVAQGPQCWHWRRPALTGLALVLYAERNGTGDLALTVGFRGTEGFLAVGRITVPDGHPDRAPISTWIDANVVDRFGPIRQIKQGLVVEISYMGSKIAGRRKAGFELREPAFIGARWDSAIDGIARIEDVAGALPLQNQPAADAASSSASPER